MEQSENRLWPEREGVDTHGDVWAGKDTENKTMQIDIDRKDGGRKHL